MFLSSAQLTGCARRTSFFFFLFTFLFAFTVSSFAALEVITVPYNQGNPSIPHYAYNGHPTTFKAIARGGSSSTVTYSWDFNGDGVFDYTKSTSNKYDLSAQYTYPNHTSNMTYSAIIKVTCGSETMYGSYPVVVFANATRDIKVNVAADDGLWWLHNYLTRTTAGYPSVPVAYSKQSSRRTARTAAIAWAMQVQGHIGDETKYDVDPYVEDVVRCLNYIFAHTTYGTLSNQTYLGDPEAGVPSANNNNRYLKLNDSGTNIYDNSIILATLASSGTPDKLAATQISSSGYTKDKSFKWIAQEFVDHLAFGQIDGGAGRGGWEYNIRNNSTYRGYSSMGMWAYLALEGAEESFECHVPDNLKSELEYFLLNSGIHKLVSGSDYGVFLYHTGVGNTGRRNKQLTGGGLIAMNMLGWDEPSHQYHSRWQAAYECLARNWDTKIYTSWAIDYNVTHAYARYSIMKGARTASPEIESFDYNGTQHFWYNEYADEITSTQLSDNSWPNDGKDTNSYLKTDLIVALNVLTLTRSLFDPTPEAIAQATPLTVIEGCSGGGAGQVIFAHDQSFHANPARDIVLYEWDFDSDGTYDYQTNDKNAQVTHTYMHHGTYTATLRITDNNSPVKTDTDAVNITVTASVNSKPTANAGGPYVSSQGDPVTFNASLSQDPDQPCGDTIASYAWDLDGDGQYDDGTGVTLTKTWTQLQAYGLSYPASHTTGLPKNTVAVRVTDQSGLTDTATTTLTIYDNRPFAVGTAVPSLASCSQSITFNATSSYHGHPGHSLTLYEWDFESDGVYDATGITTQYSYSSYGTYSVTLRVTDDNIPAKTSTTVISVEVSEGKLDPVAVTPETYRIAQGTALTLDGTGSYDLDSGCGGGIVSYLWDIDGDGQFDDAQGATPTVPWTTLASLAQPADPVTNLPSNTIYLKVTDVFGAESTDSAILYIYANQPYAVLQVTPLQSACNELVTINGNASYHGYPQAGNYISSYEIDFGDSSSTVSGTLQSGDTIPETTHSYSQYGTYTVTLTVHDNNGISDTDTVTVQVNQGNEAPVASAGESYQVTEGDSVQVSALASTDANLSCGDQLTFAWDIDGNGDFNDAAGANPVIPWSLLSGLNQPADPQTGLPYNIFKVQVTDSFGQSSIAQATLRIYADDPIAVISAVPNPAGCGQVITFSGANSTHSNPLRSIISYQWDFDDDGSNDASGVQVTHAFHQFGSYTVTLTITDNAPLANQDSTQVVILVNQGNVAPAAQHGGPYVMNAGDGITLDGTGSDLNDTCESSLEYSWDLNNNGSFTDPQDADTEDVTLSWSDIQSLGWQSPADPNTGEPGNIVSFRVTDTLGLSVVKQTYIRIYHNGPYAVITANPEHAACGETVSFDGRGSWHGRPDGIISMYQWDFDDDGIYDTSGATVNHEFSGFGVYSVKLQVTDSEGHTDTETTTIYIDQGNLNPVARVGGPYDIISGDSVTFDATASSDPDISCGDYISLYEWDLNMDGVYDISSTNPTVTVSWAEMTQLTGLVMPADPQTGLPVNPIQVRVSDSQSGSDTQNGVLRIYANQPVARFDVTPSVVPIQTSGDALFTLDGSDSYHTAPGASIVLYQWDIGNDGSIDYSGTTPVQAASYTFAQPDQATTLDVTLTITDDNIPAKTDSITHTVTFEPPPTPPTADLKILDAVGGTETQIIRLGSGAVFDGSDSFDPDMGDPYYDYFKQARWDINGDGTYDVTRVLTDTNNDQVINNNDGPIDLVLELTQAQLAGYGVMPNIPYVAVLELTDALDETDTDSAQFTVVADEAVALLDAYPNPAGCNQTVTLDAGSSYNSFPGRTIVKYEWDLNDDGVFELDTGVQATTTIAYPAYGNYPVSVKVTDDNGSYNTAATTVEVSQGNTPPVASTGGPYIFNYEENFQFAGSSNDLNISCGDSIESYAWDLDGDSQFDDGSGATPTVVWADFESLIGQAIVQGQHYPVALQVTDSFGATGTHSTYMTFYHNEVIASLSASPNPAGCNQAIVFDAGTSYNPHPSYNVARYEWDFDYNGINFDIEQSGTETSVTHNFDMYRTYTVAVRAIDTNIPERSDIATVDVVIDQGNLAPVADAGGTYITEVGQGLTLDASGSFDPNAACGDMILEYAWDIDGNDTTWELTSSSAQTSLPWTSISTWTIGQAYPVKVRVTDTFGSVAYAQTTVTVYENTPIAVASASPNPAACNQEVTLTGTASHHTYPARAIVMYRWDIDGDGTFDIEGSDKGQITFTYPAFDVYTVKLRVEDNNDPIQWDETTVDVVVNLGNHNPQAAISGALQISVGDPLVLSGLDSTDPDIGCNDYIVSYQWDIDGDGDFDEMISGESINLPWSMYSSMVDYPADPLTGVPSNQISLKVTDSLGKTNTRTRTLYIYDNQPVALFTVSANPAGCNQTLTFDASSSYHKNPTRNIVSYQWDFDGDMVFDAQGVSVTHSYPAFGSNTVTLRVTDDNDTPLTDEDQKVVVINLGNQKPVADPDPDNPNNGYILTYGTDLTLDGSASYDPNQTCGDSIVLYEWDIDNNGTYDVNGSTVSIPWDQLIGTYNMQYPEVDNTVVLRVTDSFGQTNTASVQVEIFYNEPVAVASAVPTTASCNQIISFDGTGSYHKHILHSIVLYEWDFEGDGTYDATGATVEHYYSMIDSTVTARLRVTDDQNLTATDTVQITISTLNSAPVADAGGPYTSSVGNTLVLDGRASYDPNENCGDSIVTWSWDTDSDGLYGAEDTNGANGHAGSDYVGETIPAYSNPNWQKGLTYTIRLKVTDMRGLVSPPDATTVYIAPDPPPVVQVTSPNSSMCLHGMATVSYTVRDPEGDVVTLTAKIGSTVIDSRQLDTNDDGTTSTVSFTFDTTAFTDASNYYYVTVLADDGEGGQGQDVSDSAFTIDNTPPAAPTVAVPAAGVCYATLPATSASSTDNFTANPTISRVDSNDGCSWTSTFTATDACGNQSSATVVSYQVSDATVSVVIGGIVEGGIYAPGRAVTYGHSSSANCVSEVSGVWSMLGGLQNQAFTSSAVFNNSGEYTVLVTVTNVCGSQISDSRNFVINGAPVADAGGPYNGTEGVAVALSGSGSTDPDSALSYAWDLDGDGEFDDANTMDTSVQFDESGTYTVSLKVTDSLGAWDTDSAQIIISNTAPVVDAGDGQTVDEGDTVTFAGSFTDTGDESSAHIIHWSFGDGSTSDDILNPTHVYGDNGVYTVTLTVTDDDGAEGVDTMNVVVNNVAPTLDVVPEQLIGNEGELMSFNATYADVGSLDTHTVNIDWDDLTTEDREVSGGAFDGTHTYLFKGTYTVTVTVRDDDGDESQDSFTLTIGRVPINLQVRIENDRSATITFDAVTGKYYDIYYFEGDIMNYTDIEQWQLLDTVLAVDQGLVNDSGDPGADGQFGTTDDVRPAPSDVPIRYYRVVEAGSIDSGEPWASGQIGYYQSCVLVDGRNFIGKTGCSHTLDQAVDCRFLRLGYDVELMHQGVKIDYPKNQALQKAFVYDANGYLLWTDGTIDVSDDPLSPGAGFLMTLNPGMGPKHLPMAGIIETSDEVSIEIYQASYTLVTWPYANETSLDDSGLIESGFYGDIRARTADMIYFWNAESQTYDLPVFYFTGTGEWRNYDQSPCTKTLKPGESILIKTTSSSSLTQWHIERPYPKPSHDLNP